VRNPKGSPNIAEVRRSTPDSLDAALADLMEAFPWKRWYILLSGDWENGWEAEAHSRPMGEPGVTVTTNGSGWFHEPGGYDTPAAAVRALTKKLRAQA
jgi:hypothetical protein